MVHWSFLLLLLLLADVIGQRLARLTGQELAQKRCIEIGREKEREREIKIERHRDRDRERELKIQREIEKESE